MAPARVTRSMFSIMISEYGVSRGTRIRRRRSLRQTSAARSMRFDDAPHAMRPRVPPEQGTIAMPSVL